MLELFLGFGLCSPWDDFAQFWEVFQDQAAEDILKAILLSALIIVGLFLESSTLMFRSLGSLAGVLCALFSHKNLCSFIAAYRCA